MLIAVRFRNFLSFRDEADLTLIAHKADKTLQNCLIKANVSPRKQIELVPAIAIYGANSAGKTNVLRAVEYLRDAVLNSHSRWNPSGHTRYRPFRTKSQFREPGSIEIDFIVKGARYTYGIAATPEIFVEEWLKSYPNGREHELFARKATVPENYDDLPEGAQVEGKADIHISAKFAPDHDYAVSIAKKIRHNSLFLSVAAQDNHKECREIYDWFSGLELENVTPAMDRTNAMSAAGRIADDPSAKSAVLQIMRAADPNLVDIIIQKRDFSNDTPEFLDELSEQHKRRFFEDFKYAIRFAFAYENEKITLSFDVQSRGFQKLFALSARILDCLKSGRTLFIDEIESSIHPHLARFVIDLFQNPEVNTGKSQIIFTTHDTSMLDQSLLRRDQIWFVEKKDCRSELYSLLEFSPRKDENLERGYLRGRYGAIPALGMSANWLEVAADDAQNEQAAHA